MASSSSMLNVCRKCRTIFANSSRVWRRNVCQTSPKKYLLTASVFLAHCQIKEKLDLKAPDGDRLSQDYLLKAASANTADSVTTLLSQTAHALIQAEEKYRHVTYVVDADVKLPKNQSIMTVGVLMELLEYHMTVLGNSAEEDRVWDVILQARARVQTYQRHIQDLQMLLSCVEKLTDAAAEASFLAGSEFSSTSLGERLYNAQRHIESAQQQSQEIDSQLREVEAQCIQATTQHAEKEERRRKAEDELFGEGTEQEDLSLPNEEGEAEQDDHNNVNNTSER